MLRWWTSWDDISQDPQEIDLSDVAMLDDARAPDIDAYDALRDLLGKLQAQARSRQQPSH